MKTIKIFIASSEELSEEREKLALMVHQLNRVFRPRGYEIQDEMWEYLDASMGPQHKQEEYNRVLKECDICLVMYWTKFGTYTHTELDTAYTELCAGHKPYKLYIYFKENTNTEVSQELKVFKEEFEKLYGHFYGRFESVDALKLNVLLQLEGYITTSQSHDLLQVKGSKVEIDGEQFVDLQNVSFAGNNAELQKLIGEIKEAQARVLQEPNNGDLWQLVHDLQQKREKIEASMLDTARLITKLSSETVSTRFAEAIRRFELGDNSGAKKILDDEAIKADALSARRNIEAAREKEESARRALEQHIEEWKLKIKILQNELASGWFENVVTLYDNAIEISRDFIDPEKFAELLSNYATFLYENNQYHLIGSLYDECLTIYRYLAEKNPEALEPDVAKAIGNLANLHRNRQQYDVAEEEYQEALEIYRRLAEKNPETFESDVATTLNNLAILHRICQRYDLAEKEYKEALEIRRHLAEKNLEAFEPDIAETLNNLAILHRNCHLYDVAEEEYQKTLEIRRRLAKKNPKRFASYVARTLNNLAILHKNLQRYNEAEEEFQEALEIYKHLAVRNPKALESYIARTLYNLAALHYNCQRYNVAKEKFQEALEIYKRLAEKNTVYNNIIKNIEKDLARAF